MQNTNFSPEIYPKFIRFGSFRITDYEIFHYPDNIRITDYPLDALFDSLKNYIKMGNPYIVSPPPV